MTLSDEIKERSREINTDSYPMSIGELMSLYKDGELDIHPEFQRFFRWTLLQKSKLIESILLGIPIPSIFVSQREDGIWDVIDGLQRLSTIFQFAGILKDENGRLIPPTKLLETEYLPSLKGKYWESPNPIESLDSAQRMFIKRNKIDIKIVKKESDKNVKYDLFQRLNTLGSTLSDQEVRNCLLVMYDKTFFEWMRKLANFEPFLETLSLADRLIEEQYNMELVLRFFVFKNIDISEIRGINDLGDFLTKKMMKFTKDPDFNREKEAKIFEKTFQVISRATGDSTFKRYDLSSDKFSGKFLLSTFESIAIGIGHNIDTWDKDADNSQLVTDKIKSLWQDSDFKRRYGSGINVNMRVPVIVPLGKRLFKNEDTD